jgi:PAS domain S-box-containing protein
MERPELDQWKAREVARLLALVETERRYYQDIVATLPIGLLIVAADLQVISANRAFRRTFDLRADQVLRQRIEDVLPLEGLTALIQEIILSGGTRQHILYEPEATPGGRYLRVSIASVRDWEEESERDALLLVEDLTDIHAALAPPAEPELEQAPAPLEMAVAIHWETDAAALEIHPLNNGLAVLLGYASEEWAVPGFWWSAVAGGDAGWVGDFFRRAAAEVEIRHCDHRMRAADGRTVWVRSVVRPVLDSEGAVAKLTGVTIDITSAREREQQLVEARILDAMALWSGRLTHDFNNLLMIVTGYGREILDSLPARDARRGDLQEILRTAERVSGMVRELMTLSRPPIPEPQQLDLNEAVRGMETRLAGLVAGKAALRLSLDPGAGLVSVDAAHLETMVATLVKQAAQVAGAGASIAIQTSRVEIGERYASPDAPPKSCVMLKVRPENVTIDAETRERLFEPLLATKEPELAPGLFPICGIVRQAEGEVRVEQEPGGGTVFALYLPRIAEPPVAILEAPLEAPAEPAPQQAEPAEAPPEETAPAEALPEEAAAEEAPSSQEAPIEFIEIPIAEAPAAEIVLLVEDDPGIRALMRKILLRQGFVVLEASSGEESLQLAEGHQGPIQLLITDLMMPEMNGREVSERLKAARPDLKVVFVSGYTDDPMIQSGQLPEGTVFLQKPFTLGALLDKVRDVLGHDIPAE